MNDDDLPASEDVARQRKIRRGWARIYRSLVDSPIFQDAELLRLVVFLILRANHRERTVRVKTGRGQKAVAVGVGQALVGIPSLAAKLRTPKTSCKRRLLKLQSVGFVALQTHRHFTIATLLNWATYNPAKSRRNPESGAANGASSGATTGATNGHKQEFPSTKNYQKNPSTEKRRGAGSGSGVYVNLDSTALRDFDVLRAWFDQESLRPDGWVSGSDFEWQNVQATAAKALSDPTIDDPVAFAKDTIGNQRWDRLSPRHDAIAKGMRRDGDRCARSKATRADEPRSLGEVLSEAAATRLLPEGV